MYYTYVLKSIEKDFYYKGHCQDLAKRLAQHNAGMTRSTKPYIPLKVAYFEKFKLKVDAIKREKYFKTAAGRKFLKSIQVP